MMLPYDSLAGVYDTAGLAEVTENLRQRLFDRVQMEGWLGRRVLVLGCGTGTAACWFGGNSFRVTAVDQSPAMLAVARARAEALGVAVDWREGDIAALEIDDGYDLVLALDTLNELRSIREVEAAFQMASRALNPGKMLLFDLTTLRGFADQWAGVTRVLHDDPESLLVMVRSDYSFETAINTRQYTIFQREDAGWYRADETHTLRAFSLQAIGLALQRAGFKVEQVIDPSLRPFDPNANRTGRAVFVAVKAT